MFRRNSFIDPFDRSHKKMFFFRYLAGLCRLPEPVQAIDLLLLLLFLIYYIESILGVKKMARIRNTTLHSKIRLTALLLLKIN